MAEITPSERKSAISEWLDATLVRSNIVPNILFHIVTTISSLDVLRSWASKMLLN